ncbi:hypothetical protein BLA29_000164 [Euroglyphus maynei]|uniref:Uncharacterized protein n=1 Tax=Euroglyphus maynei TaxID=6958 RepID=A0A1Y3BND8_EURMA|nr:hypothetical protein BLA29_000164 [Euroglyphus maynei]
MDESIAKVYKQMTMSQIEALQNELQLHDHFIYEPIREKCSKIETEFEQSCHHYDQNGDIYRLEKDFLATGDQVVSLQKMVIRIINSKLEQRLRQPKQSSAERKNYEIGTDILDQFDYLCRSFFGLPFSSYKTFAFTPINQLVALTERLQTVDAIRLPIIYGDDEGTKIDSNGLNRLSVLLRRLRHTYYLYRMASYSNQIMDTFYLKPLAYQATLGLVDTVGYLTWSDPENSVILSQLRFLVRLFSGNLQLNIFAQPNIVKQSSKKIDPNQLRQLIDRLKQHEQKQRDRMEQNRLSTMMENLMENQQRQQTQIDKILHVLASSSPSKHEITTEKNHKSTTTPKSTATTTAVEKPKKQHHHMTSTTTIKSMITTTVRPSESIVRGGDTLRQLKQQRKLLNELLEELQKPLNHTSSSSSMMKPNHDKPMMANDGPNRQKNLGQAQNALMAIMQNITPLISVMAQSQMVTQPKIDRSKLDLLAIVQTMNNNQQILLDSSSSSVIDFSGPFNIMANLAIRLRKILDGFINDLNQTRF